VKLLQYRCYGSILLIKSGIIHVSCLISASSIFEQNGHLIEMRKNALLQILQLPFSKYLKC